MQFSNFSRSVEGLTITFFNDIPVENVGKINFYQDNKTGVFSKKEFRWSFNNEYWSSWQSLTQSGLSSILTYSNYYFFLEIRYVLFSIDSGSVTNFMIDYEIGTATLITPRIFNEDIQHSDSSAILIHDIIQEYKITTIEDADSLNVHSGEYYLNRANHVGKQPISTISGLQSQLNALSSVKYVKESSLGSSFIWIGNYLDISVHTSSDISINYLYNYNLIQDSSINNLYDIKSNLTYVDGSLFSRDLSINNLYDIKVPYTGAVQDVSLNKKNITEVQSVTFNPSTYVNEPYKLAWDEDEQTLSLGLPDGGSAQYGKEVFDYFTNLSGVTLIDGDIVSVTGATGNRLAVTLTDPKNYLNAVACIGMVTAGAGPNQKVRVTFYGSVHELNTDAFEEGDLLYVDPENPGKLTNLQPIAPNIKVAVGLVSVKHHVEGVIGVHPKIINSLKYLNDVDTSGLSTTGQFLTWNTDTSVFKLDNINNYTSKTYVDGSLNSKISYISSGFNSISNITLTSGLKGYRELVEDYNIESYKLIADVSSYATVTINKNDVSLFDVSLNYETNKSGLLNYDISSGDILSYYISDPSLLKRLSLFLKLKKI